MTTIEYDKTPGECQHRLSDETTVTHTVLVRDLIEGRERKTLGYYCSQHRRYGRWMTSEDIPPTAKKALMEAADAGQV